MFFIHVFILSFNKYVTALYIPDPVVNSVDTGVNKSMFLSHGTYFLISFILYACAILCIIFRQFHPPSWLCLVKLLSVIMLIPYTTLPLGRALL